MSLRPASRSYFAHLLRTKWRTAFRRRTTPPFVTFYVTTKCDEKCLHCYYWDQLNPKPNRDLRLEEFRKIFASMGEIYNLFLGGGEPFLRPDLAEIILAAAKTNQLANVYVPTNGQHARRTVEVVEEVLSRAPRLRFHLNLSVDHVDPAEYDRIRGRPGAWRRMLATAQAVRPLRERYPNLVLHTLTTLMRENQAEIHEIHEQLKRIFRPDGTSYTYCRGDPLDPQQREVSPESYRALARRLEREFIERGPKRGAGAPYGVVNHLLDQRVRQTVERTLVQRRAQFSCVSGRLACVIYSDGEVVECEMKNSSLGNLRDVDYDFRRLWFSERANEVAREAAQGCFCTHECGHYASNAYSLVEVAKIAGKAALRGVRPR